MANPALSSDVESRWRLLTDTELLIVNTRLDDAWRKLRRLVPDLEDRMVSDVDLTDEAIQVLSDAVIRLLENPRGHTKGAKSIDDRSESWEIHEDWARGEIHFTQAELDGLSAAPVETRKAFSVMPS